MFAVDFWKNLESSASNAVNTMKWVMVFYVGLLILYAILKTLDISFRKYKRVRREKKLNGAM